MAPKPVVAVSADHRLLEPHPSHVAGEKYLRALIDGADTLPLIVPSMAGGIDVDGLLDRVDGVMLTGSYSNVAPDRYGAKPSHDPGFHDPQRDAFTLPLAIRALQKSVPLFAVCRGHQELNVALGGTLHQNVHEVSGYHRHLENKDDPLDVQYGPAHSVTLTDNGMLGRLAGSDTQMVNSLHGQGIARLAEGVTVEAVADDGLIEAFSVDSASTFSLSVQWHPEWRVTENEFSMAIFKAFGDACRTHANSKRGT